MIIKKIKLLDFGQKIVIRGILPDEREYFSRIKLKHKKRIATSSQHIVVSTTKCKVGNTDGYASIKSQSINSAI